MSKFCFAGCSRNDIQISTVKKEKNIYSETKKENFIKKEDINESSSDEYMFFSGGV